MRFWVPGKPQSKGSWAVVRNKRTGKPQLIPQAKGEPGWAKAVAWTAKNAMRGLQPFKGPCAVSVTLLLERPKTTKFAYPVRPDSDKGLRSILDALTGIAYDDDRQAVSVCLVKTWADKRGPGAEIIVQEIP